MSRNKKVVPNTKATLDAFKYEIASKRGLPLSKGYNGDLTSYQNGSVGGYLWEAAFSLRRVHCDKQYFYMSAIFVYSNF